MTINSSPQFRSLTAVNCRNCGKYYRNSAAAVVTYIIGNCGRARNVYCLNCGKEAR